MLSQKYSALTQELFTIAIEPEPVLEVADIAAYNQKEGLALNEEEIEYLNNLSEKLGRKLTDSEVFGFSQVNREHCRHKIFNGTFIIDGEEKPTSLFQLIKKTSQGIPIDRLSLQGQCGLLEGARTRPICASSARCSRFLQGNPFESVLSLKAETHNFPNHRRALQWSGYRFRRRDPGPAGRWTGFLAPWPVPQCI